MHIVVVLLEVLWLDAPRRRTWQTGAAAWWQFHCPT